MQGRHAVMPDAFVKSPALQSWQPSALVVAPSIVPLVPGKQGEQSAAEAKPSIALNVPTAQGEPVCP